MAAPDRGVPAVQPAGHRQRPVEGAENHAEDDLERPVEAADRVGEGTRVLRDPGGDPGVGELEQERAPAPRNVAASRSIIHVTDFGPNTPSDGPAAAALTAASSRSRSSAVTARVAALPLGESRSADTVPSQACTPPLPEAP
jgi:hypothetical protein